MHVIAKNQYAVRMQNLSEQEQVILNMIFAISQKSAARANGYSLALEPGVPVDIVIRGDDSVATGNAAIAELRVVDAMPADSDQPVLLRPLIATRVLAVLDDVMAHATQARTPVVNRGNGVVVEFKSSVPPQEAPFVVDEAESHPDNFSSPDITPQDGEAVAAAVDAMLLNTPLDDENPVEAAEQGSAAPTVVSPAAPRRRALVVAESAAVRKQIEIELKVFSVDVDYAATARRAIELIESDDYAIAFVDAVLTEWDGYRICKRIKARQPHTAVMMLLSQFAAGDRLKGTLAGCDGYLVKPVGRLTFQTLVRNHLPVQAGARPLGV